MNLLNWKRRYAVITGIVAALAALVLAFNVARSQPDIRSLTPYELIDAWADNRTALIRRERVLNLGRKLGMRDVLNSWSGMSGFLRQGEALTQALRSMDAAALPSLLDATHDRRLEVRQWALRWMGEILAKKNASASLDAIPERDAIMERLMETLGDKDELMRGASFFAMRQFGAYAEAAVPLLISILRNGAAPETTFAARTLAAIGPEGAAPATPVLLQLLQHPDKWTRKEAAEALAVIAPEALAGVEAAAR